MKNVIVHKKLTALLERFQIPRENFEKTDLFKYHSSLLIRFQESVPIPFKVSKRTWF